MASREEFAAFIRSDHQQQEQRQHPQPLEGNGNYGATADFMSTWAKQGQGSPQPPSRPPQSRRAGEHAPLLMPPIPQSASSKPRGHGRSRSDYVLGAQPPSLDPAHPLKKGVLPAPINRTSNRPPRGVGGPPPPPPPPLPQSFAVPRSASPKGQHPDRRSRHAHRRAKSDIPLALLNSGGSRRDITKADLLKNFPNPRWGGAAPSVKPINHTRNRSRTGSEGYLSGVDDGRSVSSGISGYGAIGSGGGDPFARNHPLLGSIGSVELAPDAKRATGHARTMSDASAKSVTTNLAKSSLFKGVTDTGRIQLQLPKDSFRMLMDNQLEAGCVYKRKLVDSEDEFFVEFHTEEDHPTDHAPHCSCVCDNCHRCHEKQKRLPPDLYVMAVDSTIYRRMLDEVIQSQTMPCGTFFCGHHEDVRHPDITIAALIVGLVFFLLLAGSFLIFE
mmetsp:Transcript_15676/g.33120  ORF Transcript_15676/g.33120 Transcript_15676/m.33120 type:complete len:444 (-) Transcript_15676:226-1557(-)|eukprot:CAMPEP_0183730336 /NCGR_PEP_ID=MMETSP0737-20130205/32577_1 /TAXON_ID=385413 /ORGANISM="Thalassiosira miniscula, Strain CCMP1093" /LENGTH=443 /DNA_ID=CAMNT_0025962795 /DNA_START=100 /DNA_END=1431 /DNA_ORIENTATION=-